MTIPKELEKYEGQVDLCKNTSSFILLMINLTVCD